MNTREAIEAVAVLLVLFVLHMLAINFLCALTDEFFRKGPR